MGMIEIPIERREPVMHWIPCSERLPEEGVYEEYLVTIKHKNPKYKARFISVTEYDSRDEDYPQSWQFRNYDYDDVAYVVAWMPLPEPYQPEEGSE